AGAFKPAEGGGHMKRIFVFACASLSFGPLASPLAAQEMAQAAPQAEQLPPPPSSRPSHRFVDMGGHHPSRARSKASPARHASSVKRSSKAHASSKSHT